MNVSPKSYLGKFVPLVFVQFQPEFSTFSFLVVADWQENGSQITGVQT